MKTATLLALSFLLPRAVAAQTNVGTAVQVQSENKKPHVRLKPGKPIEKELAGGAMDTYEIRVKKGQFLHAIVDQKGIDVALTLYSPDGKQIATMDSPNGSYGLEQISTIAQSAGAYRLEIASGDKNARAGRYRVSINLPRAPTDADRARLSAERLFADATQLSVQGGAESRQSAIQEYEDSLPLWRTARDDYEEYLTRTALGDMYHRLGQTAKALPYYNQALTLARRMSDLQAQAETLANLGISYDETSNLQMAKQSYELALDLYRQLGDTVGQGRMLHGLGNYYKDLGDQKKALDLYQKALVLETLSGDLPVKAATLTGLGMVYADLGVYEKALEFFQQALSESRALGDKIRQATVLSNIAVVYDDLGDESKALDFYQQTLALAQATGDMRGEAASLQGIGTVYYTFGEFQKAVAYYEQALPLERAAGYRLAESSTLACFGLVYDSMGQSQKAVEYYNQALVLFRETANRVGEAAMLSDIGEVYVNSGEYLKAASYFEQALELERAVNDHFAEAATLGNIGNLKHRLGERQDELDYDKQALQLFLNLGSRSGEAAVRRNMGKVYAELGKNEEALRNYCQALSLAREVGSAEIEAEVAARLALFWRSEGQTGMAIFFGKQAVNKIQQMRGNIRGLQKESQQSFLKSKENTYRELADLLITLGRLPEAQQVLDLLKNEEYFEFIRRDGKAASSLTAPLSLTNEEESLNREYEDNIERVTIIGNEYAALRAKTNRSPGEEKHLGELSEQVKTANAAWEKFLRGFYTELRKEKSAEDARRETAHVEQQAFGMQRVVRQLNDQPGHGVVALYTLVGQEKYRIIVVTPNVMVAREYPITAEDLREKVFEFRDVLTHPKSDPVPKAQELYRILVAPVAADLAGAKAETLMWSLDDVLRYLPIAALHDGSDYLVAKYRNEVFTPENEASLAERPDIASWRGLGMGISKSYGDFSALPSVPDELHRIIRDQSVPATGGVLPGQTMLDDAFTAQNMKKALEQKYPLVHIASHFGFSPGNDADSFLLLGGKDPQGERLTLAEIRDDPAFDFADAELVTLSACNTAVSGIAGDGREIDGLGNVAQEKGAKAVVASLWGVYDSSTGVLMQEFYKRWTTQKGMPKAEALREAQLMLLHGAQASGNFNGKGAAPNSQDSRADFSHPFYWAPFILIGNWK